MSIANSFGIEPVIWLIASELSNSTVSVPMIWLSDCNVQGYQPSAVSELSWNHSREQVIRKTPTKRNHVSRRSSGDVIALDGVITYKI